MAKINFNAISVKDIEGNDVKLTVAKELGNMMYMRGENIEECELGREIYHHEGEIELSNDQVAIVKKFIGGYSFIVRKAIISILDN